MFPISSILVDLAGPATVSFAVGVVVPIPTFPFVSRIVNRVVPLLPVLITAEFPVPAPKNARLPPFEAAYAYWFEAALNIRPALYKE